LTEISGVEKKVMYVKIILHRAQQLDYLATVGKIDSPIWNTGSIRS